MLISETPASDFFTLLADGAKALGLVLDQKQLDDLLSYLSLLMKWNAVYNLTAIREPAAMVTQHLLDSLAAIPAFMNARRVLDVGSGGGLPGIVLAIWAKSACPEMQIALVDVVRKKTAFLTQVKTELQLSNVSIYSERVERLNITEPFDIITSRAFADLSDFVRWSSHLLTISGKFVAMKGTLPEMEIKKLPSGWRVSEVRQLSVPMMPAVRHLVTVIRDNVAQ